MPTSTRLALALALALVAPACASTVVPIAPDAAADAPQDVARDVSPDVSPDAPDGDVGPVFPCSAVVVASGFSLLEGTFGTGRVVIDPARRAPVLVSFSSGAIVRVAPDTGALTRFAPPRYPGDVGRAAVFVDEGVGALVVVPLPDAPAAPTQVLSLDLARPDRWETTGIITSAAPSGTPYAVAGFDPTNPSPRAAQDIAAVKDVWSQSLQEHPSVAVSLRQAKKDVTLGGCPFRKGTMFVMAPSVVHQDPTEEPGRTANEVGYTFGAFRHKCIGLPLAEAIIDRTLADVFSRVELSVPGAGEALHARKDGFVVHPDEVTPLTVRRLS